MKGNTLGQPSQFFDQSALIYRLSGSLRDAKQEVVFLVGSPLSAPTTEEARGVPSVSGILSLIRESFAADKEQIEQFDWSIANSTDSPYQSAFHFLQGRKGQSKANEIVLAAVLSARTKTLEEPYPLLSDEDAFELLESDAAAWTISPATESLAALVTQYPHFFGRCILTTNFDPLIEIAINKTGGKKYRTVLSTDGNITQTVAEGCRVVHLHGYWFGSDTLHTNRQLTQPRPELKASLTRLLRDKLVVVCGYGGWDDIFTKTLLELIQNPSNTEVLWTFKDHQPSIAPNLADHLASGINQGRVSLYDGIDCNIMFPKLLTSWDGVASTPNSTSRSNPVRITESVAKAIVASAAAGQTHEGDAEDRPPLVDFCLGRTTEMHLLSSSLAKIAFITGIGGQGKSTLAAEYFSAWRESNRTEFSLWRDCKEESERFESQLASIVEALSNGKTLAADLARQNIQEIIDILIPLMKEKPLLFVFDNVDHYVNLEIERPIQAVDLFVNAILNSTTKCKVIFTCRPQITYTNPLILSIRLQGIDLAATKKLFFERGAASQENELVDAFTLTNGHAFWLDLLAIQVAKRAPSVSLTKLVEEVRAGQGELPSNTLQSIWSALHANERIVLRGMAETVRPARHIEIGNYLNDQLPRVKVYKAIKNLKSSNLLVVKRLTRDDVVLELHPLVRSFIRTRFNRQERSSFIEGIIKVYNGVLLSFRSQLGIRPTFFQLRTWTEAAELDIALGRVDRAIALLVEAGQAFSSNVYPREFARVVRLLLSAFNWQKEHLNYESFDVVFNQQIAILSDLGEDQEVDVLLADFELTVLERDARYIRLCQMRTYAQWMRQNFQDALKWGREGKDLKDKSSADITSNVVHYWALAERDAGNPEVALEAFRLGESMETFLDPEELDEAKDGSQYGNIGRCLHFMGQIDNALICYQKSALLIEKNEGLKSIMNQGYIRLWVGELLTARRQIQTGMKLMEAARRKWEKVSPFQAARAERLLFQLRGDEALMLRDKSEDVESVFTDWMLGVNVDILE